MYGQVRFLDNRRSISARIVVSFPLINFFESIEEEKILNPSFDDTLTSKSNFQSVNGFRFSAIMLKLAGEGHSSSLLVVTSVEQNCESQKYGGILFKRQWNEN